MINALVLAQSGSSAAGASSKNLGVEWAIVILGTLLGLAISLMPSKRTYEVKRPKDE
jgi:hypothetical protein